MYAAVAEAARCVMKRSNTQQLSVSVSPDAGAILVFSGRYETADKSLGYRIICDELEHETYRIYDAFDEEGAEGDDPRLDAHIASVVERVGDTVMRASEHVTHVDVDEGGGPETVRVFEQAPTT